MRYAARTRLDASGTFWATVVDVPDIAVSGATEAAALANALSVLLIRFEALMGAREPLPKPSTDSLVTIEIPVQAATDIDLYRGVSRQ